MYNLLEKLKCISGLKRNIYFDNNATTYVSPEVQNAMRHVLKHHWGNPSSAYYKGKMAAQIIEKARQQVADAVNAHSHEVYFTSCATESNNAVLKSLSYQFYPKKNKIISTPIEHPSVLNTLEFLKAHGIKVQYCPVDNYGFVLVKELWTIIDDDTFLICCMLANNEIGTIQNLKEITALAKSKNVLVFSDCVQALGKIPINVRDFGIDYASFSAHKLYGPKGVGALYAKITAPVVQYLHGGHQEEGLRAGTESVHNIAGFGTACKQIEKLIAYSKKMASLKKYFETEIKKVYNASIINSPFDNSLSNTMNITFPGFKSAELMMMLDYHGISVSSGSACSAHLNKPSHVLKAIGLSDRAAEETIRISIGKDTSHKDMKCLLKILAKYINKGC